jgi:hypothetical protein
MGSLSLISSANVLPAAVADINSTLFDRVETIGIGVRLYL